MGARGARRRCRPLSASAGASPPAVRKTSRTIRARRRRSAQRPDRRPDSVPGQPGRGRRRRGRHDHDLQSDRADPARLVIEGPTDRSSNEIVPHGTGRDQGHARAGRLHRLRRRGRPRDEAHGRPRAQELAERPAAALGLVGGAVVELGLRLGRLLGDQGVDPLELLLSEATIASRPGACLVGAGLDPGQRRADRLRLLEQVIASAAASRTAIASTCRSRSRAIATRAAASR